MNLPTLANNPSLWEGIGMSKQTYFRCLIGMRLLVGASRGSGNAANRRLKRIQDQHEAEQATFDWYDRNRLTEADVDNLALEWEYRNTHEV